ncbi:hypothetical protein Bpfe_006859 [Biomphalaria pfeifferi]|uniref:Uncharacterized protein n=1 Tax=Biomphalaria pfeifferi TaxID=112525 RepID=A0AAD8FH55_BIOPF|nr:hypothetical protein Bpfe_006859 [Biomphalaria pfeifferi]
MGHLMMTLTSYFWSKGITRLTSPSSLWMVLTFHVWRYIAAFKVKQVGPDLTFHVWRYIAAFKVKQVGPDLTFHVWRYIAAFKVKQVGPDLTFHVWRYIAAFKVKQVGPDLTFQARTSLELSFNIFLLE